MTWIIVAAGLGVAGLAALAVAGTRLLAAARNLNREVAGARAQLEPRQARLRHRGDETNPPAAYDRG
ncbi:hypothetical protein AB0F17_19890 [Nonomuraea sp. NPDC026600]|uniref:hypothetical protein n=1 Tax=Nonomuraea sp. NPDC026600 TaxID=3155363 RepID=UPI0033D2BBDA